MKITPLDIQQQIFKEAFFIGYNKKEVDEFLSLVKEEFEKLIVESKGLAEELKKRKNQLLEFQTREKILKDTMVTAQKVAEDIKGNSKKEGELIISQAQVQAEKIVRAAQDRLNEIIDDINELKRQRIMFESSIRSLIDKHYKLLEIAADEEIEASGLEDKLTFLTKG